MAEQRPVWLGDYRNDPLGYAAVAEKHRIAASLAIPLIVDGKGFGCLFFSYYDSPHGFSETEVDFAQKTGAVVSQALENSRLFEAEVEAQRRAEQELQATGLLLEAATAATSGTGLDPMLESLGDLLLRSTNHSRVAFELWDEERQEVEVAVSRGPAATPRRRFKFDEMSEAARQAITTRTTVVVDYAKIGLPGPLKQYVDEHAFLLLLAVPVVYRERLIGLVMVDEPGEARLFTPREIQLVEAIAAQAGSAIEHARLVAREEEAARLDEPRTSTRTTRLVQRLRPHRGAYWPPWSRSRVRSCGAERRRRHAPHPRCCRVP